jgi:thiol-disulfide isomerase/thioredoxin
MMRRRWWLLSGLAAAAGAGVAWQRFQPSAMLDGAQAAFWTQAFPGPQGEVVRMQAFRGHPLILNFWATWCPPCVEELPLLNGFYRAHGSSGWKVVGLAVDQQAPVQRFLEKQPLDFPVALAGMAGLQLARDLGNASGGLPFSVVFDAEGAVVHRKLGKIREDELTAWLELS